MPPSDAMSFARRVWITVAIVAACALGALGIWAGRSALLLIYTSLLLATGLLPLVKEIERVVGGRRWSPPRWSVISVVYAVFLGLVAIAALLIVPTLVAQADELSRRLPSLLASWQSGLVKHGWLARPLTIADAVQQTHRDRACGQRPHRDRGVRRPRAGVRRRRDRDGVDSDVLHPD